MFQGTSLNFSEIPVRREQTSPGPTVVASGGDVTALDARVDALEAAPGPAWGDVTGTLADQTDLQAALDGKQPSGSYAAASHTHTSAAISDFTEAAQDVVGAMVAAAGGSYDDGAGTITLPSASGGLSLLSTEVDLGAAKTGGKFTIPGTGMTVGKPVMIQQAVGPYTGKGTRADEAEMDQVSVSASVTAANTITAYWSSARRVRGNFKFNYQVSA